MHPIQWPVELLAKRLLPLGRIAGTVHLFIRLYHRDHARMTSHVSNQSKCAVTARRHVMLETLAAASALSVIYCACAAMLAGMATRAISNPQTREVVHHVKSFARNCPRNVTGMELLVRRQALESRPSPNTGRTVVNTSQG